MIRPAMRRLARNWWYVIGGWLAAMISSSALFVAAPEYAGALAGSCGWASPHLGVYGTVLLLAPLACIAYVAYRGGAPRKRHLKHMVPSLFVTFLVCAFAIMHMAGWGACDASTISYVAAAAAVGVVLSGVTFGVYLDVYGAPKKWPFRNTAVLACIMAVAAFACNALQAADWDPLGMPGARPFLVAIAMVATAVAAGMFGVEYAKSRGRSWKRYWVLSVVLIAVGAIAYCIVLGLNGGEVGDGDYIQLYVAQTLWSGVTIMMAMFGAYIAAKWPTNSLRLWLVPTVVLVGLIASHPGISSEWNCLSSIEICADPGPIVSLHERAGLLDEGTTFKLWVLVTALLAIWHVFTAMAAAMLGAAVAARVRAERTA